MEYQETRGLPDNVHLPHEVGAHGVQPFFKHQAIHNVAQSELQGKRVTDLREVVELRFAGDRYYSPVFPVDAMWMKVNDRIVTYAERFSDQYSAFVNGEDQRSSGTALEMLVDYGVTPAQVSVCRALKIYSIEALAELEGPRLKNLGMAGNHLKSAAVRYLQDRNGMDAMAAEITSLRAQINGATMPHAETPPEAIDQMVQEADAEYAALTDDELKDRIADLTGAGRPRGNPSRQTLIQSLRELEGASA